MTPWTVPSKVIGTMSIDSGPSVERDDERPLVARGVAQPDGLAVLRATQPVSPVPIGTRRRAGSGSATSMNVPWKAIGSHIPVSWSTR